METINRVLLTFLLNALWQVPLAAAVAALGGWCLRRSPARHRHAIWVAALAAAILLPVASVRVRDTRPVPQTEVYLPMPAGARTSAPPALALPPAPAPRTIEMPHTPASVLVIAFLLFVAVRIVLLVVAAVRTIRIRRVPFTAVPEEIARVARRCRQALGVSDVRMLFSARVSGPVTAGRTVVLPESLRGETSEAVLTTAIGHEMAHIARRDFGGNLLYQVLYLPLSFHPAAWLIHRTIERTREMACDELVTARLLDAGVYARSIVSIATAMTALPRPGYTLGVFDGDILEARIRRLLEQPASNLKRARLLLAGGLSALALCAVVASSMAWIAHAQSAAADILKQADAAARNHDAKRAAELFATAVQLEPDNLKARLSLAGALLAQYTPGTDPNTPLVTEARQQYLAVVARDPRNRDALEGLMSLATNTRQFAEAREWALQAIQADATDKFAYYTLGFLDWSLSYPDIAQARKNAGMADWDAGMIPDAAARQALRAQHESQIQEGIRMLQVALQLDPDYADAMAYLNLLNRVEAGLVDSEAQSNDLIDQANRWVEKALETKRKLAQNPRPAASPAGAERAALNLTPPPPPPPPPPANSGGDMSPAPKLVKQVDPVVPPAVRQSGASGMVQLRVMIAKDGTVKNIQVLSGPPPLIAPVLQAVRQWVYQPTLLNGQPVEVTATVRVLVDFQP